MGFQYSFWNISVSSLVILAASVFEVSIVRKNRQTHWKNGGDSYYFYFISGISLCVLRYLFFMGLTASPAFFRRVVQLFSNCGSNARSRVYSSRPAADPQPPIPENVTSVLSVSADTHDADSMDIPLLLGNSGDIPLNNNNKNNR